jgi:septal ring factor EnvC (AmiA/AmiB activator)
MDKITLIMFIGLSGFMLFLFFYIINRDKITENKLAGLELSLEEINQEIYKLKKEIKHLKENSNLEDIESIIEEVVNSIKKVEKKYFNKLNEIEEKINILESNNKKKIFDFSNVNSQDEERIKMLYKNGYSIEEISRELRIPAGEIELVLKFSNLS